MIDKKIIDKLLELCHSHFAEKGRFPDHVICDGRRYNVTICDEPTYEFLEFELETKNG